MNHSELALFISIGIFVAIGVIVVIGEFFSKSKDKQNVNK